MFRKLPLYYGNDTNARGQIEYNYVSFSFRGD